MQNSGLLRFIIASFKCSNGSRNEFENSKILDDEDEIRKTCVITDYQKRRRKKLSTPDNREKTQELRSSFILSKT